MYVDVCFIPTAYLENVGFIWHQMTEIYQVYSFLHRLHVCGCVLHSHCMMHVPFEWIFKLVLLHTPHK
jgi:hypothetical protein